MSVLTATSFLLLCAFSLSCVKQAAMEQQCTLEDMQPSGDRRAQQRLNICGPRLTRMVHARCARRGIHIGGRYGKRSIRYADSVDKPSFVLSYQEANRHFKNDKRTTGNRGIVCECCVHRCTAAELEGYCNGPKTRRRRSSSDHEKGNHAFTQAEIDAFYKELDRIVDDQSMEEMDALWPLEKFELGTDMQKTKELSSRGENGGLKRKFNDNLPDLDYSKLEEGMAEEYLELKKILRSRIKEVLRGNLTRLHDASNSHPPKRPSLSQEERKQLVQILLEDSL